MNARGHEFWAQIAINIGYAKLLKGKVTFSVLVFFLIVSGQRILCFQCDSET